MFFNTQIGWSSKQISFEKPVARDDLNEFFFIWSGSDQFTLQIRNLLRELLKNENLDQERVQILNLLEEIRNNQDLKLDIPLLSTICEELIEQLLT